ncbi:MAG TPA: serine/threonine-protein kinase [Pyrinomonadaceae bacterium]
MQNIPEERQACPSCGTALGDSITPTRPLEPAMPSATLKEDARGQKAKAQSTRAPVSYDSIDNARFVPGTILAERYRIVGLLGRGGMGEVYRADDLKLGQPVALKFLPEHLLSDGAALARFHREVRVARHVSHRNVCRVYDIGEVEGQHFLSMEFIKGEELASLLRRIGRLPSDKATEIARQLCAGLAAAHDNNVLHRDLKPANVMIDGDGNVRILDFGLAGLVEEFRDGEMHAGTPAYMSPEQLAGKELTVKSDIYSLGLVLYEVYTGKRAFEAGSLADLVKMRRSDTTPTNPSSLVKDLDPLVERVILRCLEKDPRDRPSSALQVMAALPGGDPLQAALAAGETPSPEMVAAAPKEGALRPAAAVACLASFLLVLAFLVIFSERLRYYNQVPLEKSPEILNERAQEIIKKLGYTDAPVDTDSGFSNDLSYADYTLQQGASSNGWDKIRSGQPLLLYFWYRQSPRYLDRLIMEGGDIPDPPLHISGLTNLALDTRGRLVEFYRVPPQLDAQPGTTSQPEWTPLFAAAELDAAKFRQTDSKWVPPVAYDTRAAWEGELPDHPEIPLRIEAASYQQRPVYFQLIYPWTKPLRQEEAGFSRRAWVGVILLGGVMSTVLIGSILLARRNLRLGRGDRRGAFKLAFFVFSVILLSTLLAADHVPSLGTELWTLYVAVRFALFVSIVLWLIYIALEPYVRRSWPRLLISWSRLLSGEFRDPMIGRDLLVGGLLGLGHPAAILIGGLLARWRETPGLVIIHLDLDSLRGLRVMVALMGTELVQSIFSGLAYLFFLLLMYIIVRKQRLAAVLMWLVIFTIQVVFFASAWYIVFINAAIATLLAVTTARFGLLAVIVWQFVFFLIMNWPITTNFSLWYASATIFALTVMVGLAVYGFYTSLAGQSLFRDSFLQD